MKRVFFAITAVVLILSFSIPGAWSQGPSESMPAKLAALEATVASLQAQVTDLKDKVDSYQEFFDYVTVDQSEIEGLKGPHVIFTGANVHIRSGSGCTDDWTYFGDNNLLGLGNLIVGYNEQWGIVYFPDRTSTGSHNLVVGPGHEYISYGGFVAGYGNYIRAPYSSVSGGQFNAVSGYYSSVSGGYHNVAEGDHSSISGGSGSIAIGDYSSVSGGNFNRPIGDYSSISGGSDNAVYSEYGYAPFP